MYRKTCISASLFLWSIINIFIQVIFPKIITHLNRAFKEEQTYINLKLNNCIKSQFNKFIIQKSYGARSGEYGGWSIVFIHSFSSYAFTNWSRMTTVLAFWPSVNQDLFACLTCSITDPELITSDNITYSPFLTNKYFKIPLAIVVNVSDSNFMKNQKKSFENFFLIF